MPKNTLIAIYIGYIETYILNKKNYKEKYHTDSSLEIGDIFAIRSTNNCCNISRFINAADLKIDLKKANCDYNHYYFYQNEILKVYAIIKTIEDI